MSKFFTSKNGLKTLGATAVIAYSGMALAGDPASCQNVTFSDPGWSDIGVTNAITTSLLNAMGYETNVQLLSVPIGYESIKNGGVDVFMGNWMPAQKHFINQYKDNLDVVKTNLTGVKFTLAVPSYVYDAGVKDFKDLEAHAGDFNYRIYGIAAGSPANENLQSMVDKNDFDLGDWKVVASSEQGMLSQVSRAVKRDKFIVFLGWEPHPMNVKFDMKYLSGGDDYFGPNYGGATIHTVTRKGYSEACPNVAKLLTNLEFSLDMENSIMTTATDKGEPIAKAATDWLMANPQALDNWLEGVTTLSGQPALGVVKEKMGL
ncbi:choline ABC transporter substrate-binding protein [Marinomonas aquiplantarum]|uniref:Glycine betaine/proline transport system substrate-binding protein n=1 Tax=Marinomonas aquiplantarum TaxID=491951 RepID=A0A366CZQ2_9GAMM|nr:glycine betaine/proline transport system substrate-binding protein [Marinomonas aquiplantarum]